MRVKKGHKRNSSGAAARLIRENPRTFTGDINDKKALKAFMQGEVVHKSAEKTHDNFEKTMEEIREKVATRKEKVAGMEEKFIREMPVEDKISRGISRGFKKVQKFIRKKI